MTLFVLSSKKKKALSCLYNLGHNICRLFCIFGRILFAINEMKTDYYHQKVNVRVASKVVKKFKTKDLRLFYKNHRNVWNCWLVTKYRLCQKAGKKSTAKHSMDKMKSCFKRKHGFLENNKEMRKVKLSDEKIKTNTCCDIWLGAWVE